MWKRIPIGVLLCSLLISCTPSTNESLVQLSEKWTADSGPLIGEIASIAVGKDGNVFVGDRENHTVLKYDSTGAFITRTGREGAGPGEFKDVSDVAVFGDTVYIADRENRRLCVFTTSVEYVRQVRFPRKGPSIKEIAVDNNGRLYGMGTRVGTDDWLLHGVLQPDSSRFVNLKHVHGDAVYDQFAIGTSRSNGFLAASYALKDTLEIVQFSADHTDPFPIIRDHSHEPPPPVLKDLAKLKTRPMPDANDFITWGVSADGRGYIWVLAGNYAKPRRQVFYIYNTDGERISKTTAPTAIREFVIREGYLYASTDNETQLRKFDVRYQ